MKHELASEKLLELAYGELSSGEAREVEAHAAGCGACRDELAAIRETRSLMAQLPVEPPPERGEGIVMAAARQAAEARATKRSSLLPPWLWAGSIGVFAAAAVAVVSWQLGKTAPSDALRDRGGDLMGAAKPAEVASAPAPADREKAADASELAKAAPAAQAPAEQRAPEKPKKGAEPERTVRPAKREALAEGLAGGGLAAPPGAGSIGVGGAKADHATRGRGAGMAAEAPAAPPPPPPAPAAAPRNLWAAPAEAAPQPLQDTVPPRPATKARAPSVAAAELEAYDSGPTAVRAEAMEAPAAAPAPQAERSSERKRSVAAPSAAREPVSPSSFETRSFPFCPGETRRVVERDADGRVIRYLREAEARTIEHRFGPDGRLVAAFELVNATRRALPLDTPWLVQHARGAGIDAPPRCSLP